MSRVAVVGLSCALFACGCGAGSKATQITVTASTARAPAVFLPSKCTNQVQRPAYFLTACGDGATGMEKLAWHAWGDPIAQGVGFAYVNDCEPSCATGGIHYTPAEMYVSRIRDCRARRQYTYAVIIVAAGRAARLTGAYDRTLIGVGELL
jgi:hypothetical protein